MENVITLTDQNPTEKTNCFSILTFAWFRKICSKSINNDLKVSDLYKCLQSDRSHLLTDQLERNWNQEVVLARIRNVNPSFYKAIRKTFFWNYFLYGLILLFHMAVLRPIVPILLAYFITLFSVDINSNDEIKLMYIYGGSMVLVMLVIIFIDHHNTLALNRMGMRVRVACSSLIYRKMLRLSPQSLEQYTAGEVINLLSNDVNRFDSVAFYLHHLWIMPILTAIGTTFMWHQAGIAGVISISILIVVAVPSYIYSGSLMSRLRLKVAEKTDVRVKKMSEIISGIQVIKMYTWEKPFSGLVNNVRTQELNFLTKVSYLRGVIVSASVFIERVILFITIVTYSLLGNVISASQVFSMAQIINTLQLSIVCFFPFGVNLGAETLVSVKRLQTFLLLEEKCLPKITKNEMKQVLLKNVQASWMPDLPTLRDINIRIPNGCLCAIVGPVGVGKSSLLNLLLGELIPDYGTISIDGTISYCSQKPWLFASTIMQNILFGEEYNRDLYQKVIKVCALKRDFNLLPQGDNTLVGEKGVSLSGGQKARINLARAVYKNADIYLLDDPLSAVDAHVGNELFQNCIATHLKNKTRILITHQLQYLKKVDHIIVINHGKIEAQGTFEHLSEVDIDFTKLLIRSDESSQGQQKLEDNQTVDVTTESINTTLSLSCKLHASPTDPNTNEEEVLTANASNNYYQYLKFGGSFCSLVLLVMFLLGGQMVANCSDLWITFWTSREALINSSPINDSNSNETNNVTPTSISINTAIYVYTGLISLCITLLSCGAIYFYKIAMTSSKNLHNKMFNALILAPTKFFDLNPSGRILNRFSRDMGIVDDILPQLVHMSIQIILVMIGILVMVFITNPYMIPIVLILSIGFNRVRREFVTVARNIKLLEGITKSPVFSHISSSWSGITTIRATQNESILKREFDFHQDTHTSSWYLSLVSLASFGLWLDSLGLIFFFCVVFGFILLNQYSVVSGSFVGLAISQSTILTGMVQYGISQIAQAISQMASVERILEYTKLENEECNTLHKINDGIKLWPYQGKIKFLNVSLKYSEFDPPVLQNLTFTVKAGQKVGIVGRTGAGKSSLITALFRLTPIEGTIIIDTVNIQAVSLKDLRSHISIIPQEPILFSATLRYNLDPFEKYTDAEIWTVLEEIELKDIACSLNFFVHEGGSNFSVGQRQLVCLARAILRKNKILVLDEATANVDPKTDNLIQKTIRSKFKHCTVLTVAHRLNTIMDSDQVMVMDAGKIVEYDHPYNLLQNENGYFSKMVAETNSTELKLIAENAYKNCTDND